jgi:dienelactone hydrolase
MPYKSKIQFIITIYVMYSTRYTLTQSRLASTGFVVVTVDHPYDGDIVTFPDNTTIYAANISTYEQIVDDLYVRVKDISFVLDQLSQPSVNTILLPGLGSRIDFCKVGILGHSLGGATAAQVLLSDTRFVGGFNLDGTFFGSVIEHGLENPFAIFAHEGKNITTDTTWAALWPKLTAFKRAFILNGSTHGTFSDLAEVADLIGLREKYPQQVEALLGSILGNRASQIISSYVSRFFTFVLKGEESKLLDRPSMDFPEVVIAAS